MERSTDLKQAVLWLVVFAAFALVPVATASKYHLLLAAHILLWGLFAVAFAGFGKYLGSLIVAVNMLGSLFYGALLGVFAIAFFLPKVRGTAATIGILAGEAAIFSAWYFTTISFLWYNVIGCAVVVGTALAVTYFAPARVAEVSK